MDFVDTYETQSKIGDRAKEFLRDTTPNGNRAIKFTPKGDASDADAVVMLTTSNDGHATAYWYTEGGSDATPKSLGADDVPSYARRAMKTIDGWRDYLPYDPKTTYALFYDESGTLRARYHVMTLVQQLLWPVAGKRPNWIGIAVDAAILIVFVMLIAGIVYGIHRRRLRTAPASGVGSGSPYVISQTI